jgi:hypothetical protein
LTCGVGEGAAADENDNVNVTTIGKSSEKRDIKLVTVNGERGLPKIFMDAGIHARHTTPRASGYLCS